MGDCLSFLVTVLHTYSNGEQHLIRCALKVKRSELNGAECFPEERRKFFFDKLPLHIRSCGPIVEIMEIFEVCDTTR